jgi:hypothetical protein
MTKRVADLRVGALERLEVPRTSKTSRNWAIKYLPDLIFQRADREVQLRRVPTPFPIKASLGLLAAPLTPQDTNEAEGGKNDA